MFSCWTSLLIADKWLWTDGLKCSFPLIWLRCSEMFPYRLGVGLSCISSQLHPWSSVLSQDNLPVCFCHHHTGVGHYSSHVHVWVLLHSTHLLQDCSSNTQVDTKDKYFLWCDKWRTHCWWCVILIFVHVSIWTEFTFLKGLAGLQRFPNFDSSDTSFSPVAES